MIGIGGFGQAFVGDMLGLVDGTEHIPHVELSSNAVRVSPWEAAQSPRAVVKQLRKRKHRTLRSVGMVGTGRLMRAIVHPSQKYRYRRYVLVSRAGSTAWKA